MDPLLVVALVGGLAAGLGLGLLASRRARPVTSEATGSAGIDEDAGPPSDPLPMRDADRTGSVALGPDGAALADTVTSGTLHFDERLIVTFANAAAGVVLGRPAGSLVGRSAMETFLDHAVEDLLETAPAAGSASGEMQLRERELRSLAMRARRSPSGGVWLTFDDVSELRRLQQIRAEFIDNLSHELRTPLTTVSLLAETLSREATAAGDSISPRMRERIAKIEEETGHLVQMVNELLDLSRIESGPPLALLDEVDLVGLAASTEERLRLFAERQGVRLAVDAPDPVPRVMGNEERLGQVLLNLLHNAVKFSPDGGDVTIHVRSADGLVTVAVEDQGIGVPRADRSRIFERFYKVDRARLRGGGTGLGLSIARHIVEAHGGRIRLASEEGRGSTFTIELPAVGTPAVSSAHAAS